MKQDKGVKLICAFDSAAQDFGVADSRLDRAKTEKAGRKYDKAGRKLLKYMISLEKKLHKI